MAQITIFKLDRVSSIKEVPHQHHLPANFVKYLLICNLYNSSHTKLRQAKTSDIISRGFGDFMTPLSRVQMKIKLTNARSRVTTDLHSGGGYSNTLARIESVCKTSSLYFVFFSFPLMVPLSQLSRA